MKLNKQLKVVMMVSVLGVGTITSSSAQEMHMEGMMQMDNMVLKRNVFVAMMDTMMKKMADVPRGQSPAMVFIYQMIPHHEGAIAMANYEILHGKNFEMIQLAKSIKAEQQSELLQMQIWLRKVDSKTEVTQHFTEEMNKSMETMMANMPPTNSLKDTDHAFAKVMLPHHQAAVDMARSLLTYPENSQVAAFAKQLISNEKIEIEQMSTYLNQ
jgi:uncharacterized protein (DUF305 family)